MKRCLALALILLVVLPAEARRRAAIQPPPPSVEVPPPPSDQYSASEPASVRSTHLDLDLTVDFQAQRIRGSVTHTIEQLVPSSRFIVDTQNLEITGVTIDGARAQWSLSQLMTTTGRPLTITITPNTRRVRIEYSTFRSSRALTWLDAQQTIGGIAPFLFTFVQPDRAREWIPLRTSFLDAQNTFAHSFPRAWDHCVQLLTVCRRSPWI